MIATLLLVALQAVQVAILWLHDWIPLGPLNDVAAVRRQDGVRRLAAVTSVQSLPFTIGLLSSILYPLVGARDPDWLRSWLWISYGLLFTGGVTAWWLPYLTRPTPERAARYRAMLAATHAVLPERMASSRTPCTAYCTRRPRRR